MRRSPPAPLLLLAAGTLAGTNYGHRQTSGKASAGRWHPLRRMKEERMIKHHEDLEVKINIDTKEIQKKKHRHRRKMKNKIKI